MDQKQEPASRRRWPVARNPRGLIVWDPDLYFLKSHSLIGFKDKFKLLCLLVDKFCPIWEAMCEVVDKFTQEENWDICSKSEEIKEGCFCKPTKSFSCTAKSFYDKVKGFFLNRVSFEDRDYVQAVYVYIFILIGCVILDCLWAYQSDHWIGRKETFGRCSKWNIELDSTLKQTCEKWCSVMNLK